MLTPTTQLYITDKSGQKFFKTTCSTAYKESEIRNLRRHIQAAKNCNPSYAFIDGATATIEEYEVV